MFNYLLPVLAVFSTVAVVIAAPFPIVENGEPRAKVVIADDAAPMARFAAEELIEHVRKSTGATLPLIAESEVSPDGMHRIYIGTTDSVRDQIDLADLPDDAFLIRNADGALYISGPVDGNEPINKHAGLHSGSGSGTLFGVYDFLDRVVGVRWLWPGELGTHIPQTDKIVVNDIDEIIAPAFEFRRFRSRFTYTSAETFDPILAETAFTKDVLEAYAHDQEVYKIRHRLGDTTNQRGVEHYFEGWWEKYGAEHPEWFAMDASGQRGVGANATEWQRFHVPMCVSNPELHRFIVDVAWDGSDRLSLGEVDRRVFCQCADCLAWDEPAPKSFPQFVHNLYTPQMTSNRYARFWLAVYDLAVERNPNVQIQTYLYWNYLPAPTNGIRLHGKVYGEFVPWGQDEVTYWPVSAEANEWLKAQWLGWQKAGVRLAYRPNYFWGGYVMPHLSTWQAGEFFRFAARQGMVGFDQDSLFGHWAVKGPMLYIHMRLAAHPQMSIAAIRKEYFEAFGPAAKLVEDYFNYWESYSAKRPGGGLFTPVTVRIAYPESVFQTPEKILEQARKIAAQSPDPRHLERVIFLTGGLEHAKAAAELNGLFDTGQLPTGDPARMAAAREALDKLIAIRRKYEHLYIADFAMAAMRENANLPIRQLLENEIPVSATGDSPVLDTLGEWVFRKDVNNVGVDDKWFSDEIQDQAQWQPITVSTFWDYTDVGEYTGYGWYRTEFTIPEQYWNEPLSLYFDAVDEQAWVYVNGELVGEHTVESEGLPIDDLWQKPFSVSLPIDRLRHDGPNTVTVRVHNSTAVGGIWRGVRLWAPRELH